LLFRLEPAGAFGFMSRATRATIAAIIIALLPSLALAQQPVPRPPGPGGSCRHGYSGVGRVLRVARAGAQEAIPLPPNGTCPHSWLLSGSFCLRSGSGR
jgi:hypothetical protein